MLERLRNEACYFADDLAVIVKECYKIYYFHNGCENNLEGSVVILNISNGIITSSHVRVELEENEKEAWRLIKEMEEKINEG